MEINTIALEIFSDSNFWRINVDAQPMGRATAVVSALDENTFLAEAQVPGGPTWANLVGACFGSGSVKITPATLQSVGQRLFNHVLTGDVRAKFEEASKDATENLRMSICVVPHNHDDQIRRIPWEIAFRDRDLTFVFRSSRCGYSTSYYEFSPRSWLLPEAGSALIATSTGDILQPSESELREHAEMVATCLRQKKWIADVVHNITRDELQHRIRSGYHVIYLMCHGTEAEDFGGGRLRLTGSSIVGSDLADHLREKPPRLLMVMACSSAATTRALGASSLVEYAVRHAKVPAAIGFRTEVDPEWAMKFGMLVVTDLAEGVAVDFAVARARVSMTTRDPQWVLPVLFAHPLPNPRQYDGGHDRRLHLRPPSVRSDYAGRENELQVASDWLASTSDALLTITGDAGVGKTELAAAIAALAKRRGRESLWLSRPDANLPASIIQIARALEIPMAVVSDAELLANIRSRTDTMSGLLVLDDVSSDDIEGRLRLGSQWKTIITARSTAISSSTSIKLSGLGIDAATALAASLLWLTEAEVDSLAGDLGAFVSNLDGVPLAIEAATAKARRQQDASIAVSAARTIGPPGTDTTTSTLETMFAVLDQEQAKLLSAVATFGVEGATPRMIATVLEQPTPVVQDGLPSLIRQRLLRFDSNREVVSLHPLFRTWLRESGAAGQRIDSRRTATSIAAQLESIASDWEYDESTVERWNQLRGVLDVLDDPDFAIGNTSWGPAPKQVNVILLLDRYMQLDVPLAKRRSRLESTVSMFQLSEAKDDGFLYLGLLSSLGAIAEDMGDDDLVGDCNRRMEEAAKLVPGVVVIDDDDDGIKQEATKDIGHAAHERRTTVHDAFWLRRSANVLFARGRSAEALDKLTAAIGVAAAIRHRLEMARSLELRGRVNHWVSRLKEAREDFDSALAIFSALGSRMGIATTLASSSGLRMLLEQRPDDAFHEADRAVVWMRQLGPRNARIVDLYLSLADAARRSYRFEDAFRAVSSAVESVPDTWLELGLRARASRAEIATDLSDLDAARRDLDWFLSQNLDVGPSTRAGQSFQTMGEVATRLSRISEAVPLLRRALAIFLSIEDHREAVNTCIQIASIAFDYKDRRHAEEHVNIAHAHMQHVEDDLAEANLLILDAKLAGEPRQVVQILGVAVGLLRKQHAFKTLGTALLEKARAHLKLGQTQFAMDSAHEARLCGEKSRIRSIVRDADDLLALVDALAKPDGEKS